MLSFPCKIIIFRFFFLSKPPCWLNGRKFHVHYFPDDNFTRERQHILKNPSWNHMRFNLIPWNNFYRNINSVSLFVDPLLGEFGSVDLFPLMFNVESECVRECYICLSMPFQSVCMFLFVWLTRMPVHEKNGCLNSKIEEVESKKNTKNVIQHYAVVACTSFNCNPFYNFVQRNNCLWFKFFSIRVFIMQNIRTRKKKIGKIEIDIGLIMKWMNGQMWKNPFDLFSIGSQVQNLKDVGHCWD